MADPGLTRKRLQKLCSESILPQSSFYSVYTIMQQVADFSTDTMYNKVTANAKNI